MTTLIGVTPYVALVLGVAMIARALHLYSESRPQTAESIQHKLRFLYFAMLAVPSMAHAAAVGIVAAGVAMMMGRQSIAKWAFAGAMVSGLAFAIVKTMWGNMGLEASGVSSFSP